MPKPKTTYHKLKKYFSDPNVQNNVFVPSAIESVVALSCAVIITPFISNDTELLYRP